MSTVHYLKCWKCEEQQNGVLKTLNKTYTIRGTEVNFDIELEVCPSCGEHFRNKENIQKILQAARKAWEEKIDFSAEDLKKVIQKLNIPEELFAKILGTTLENIQKYQQGRLAPTTFFIKNCKKINENERYAIVLLQEHKEHFTREEKELLFAIRKKGTVDAK